MDDLQSTLQSILSDPEQMRRIAAMAESLGLKPPDAAPSAGHPEQSTESVPSSGHTERSEESVSQSDRTLFPRHSERSEESVPPGIPDLFKLMSGLSAMQGTEDRVFAALRPSLSPAGQGKADRAVRAAKLAKLASRFLTRQRDGHV